MGFFSWDCRSCGHPLLSRHVVNGINYWMNDAVTILKNGEVVKGSYDGYGRIGEFCLVRDGYGLKACVYHEACWETAGRPTKYAESTRSDDQGYFYGDPVHDMENPAILTISAKESENVTKNNC